jgi:WD40 repeat protein
VSTLEGHQDLVTSVCVTVDREKIISGSQDETVKVFLALLHLASLDWLVRQFKAHKGSEAKMHSVMSVFSKLSLRIIASESDERFTYLSRVIELGAPDEMLEGLFKVLAG